MVSVLHILTDMLLHTQTCCWASSWQCPLSLRISVWTPCQYDSISPPSHLHPSMLSCSHLPLRLLPFVLRSWVVCFGTAKWITQESLTGTIHSSHFTWCPAVTPTHLLLSPPFLDILWKTNYEMGQVDFFFCESNFVLSPHLLKNLCYYMLGKGRGQAMSLKTSRVMEEMHSEAW